MKSPQLSSMMIKSFSPRIKSTTLELMSRLFDKPQIVVVLWTWTSSLKLLGIPDSFLYFSNLLAIFRFLELFLLNNSLIYKMERFYEATFITNVYKTRLKYKVCSILSIFKLAYVAIVWDYRLVQNKIKTKNLHRKSNVLTSKCSTWLTVKPQTDFIKKLSVGETLRPPYLFFRGQQMKIFKNLMHKLLGLRKRSIPEEFMTIGHCIWPYSEIVWRKVTQMIWRSLELKRRPRFARSNYQLSQVHKEIILLPFFWNNVFFTLTYDLEITNDTENSISALSESIVCTDEGSKQALRYEQASEYRVGRASTCCKH